MIVEPFVKSSVASQELVTESWYTSNASEYLRLDYHGIPNHVRTVHRRHKAGFAR